MITKEQLEINRLINENRVLKEENKDLFMRLAAIKTIINRVKPICSQKLESMLKECEECSEAEN